MASRCSSFEVRATETNQQRKAIGDAVEKSGAAGASQGRPGVAIHAVGTDVTRGIGVGGRYFRQLELARRIRRHVGGTVPGTDYGVVGMVVLLLTLLLVGGRRVRHVSYLAGDPLVARL